LKKKKGFDIMIKEILPAHPYRLAGYGSLKKTFLSDGNQTERKEIKGA
jgi:hypothetical protein